MMDELSERTLGRYQVLERLGRGGMAEVYRAYQPSLDRYVAIKVIYPHLATDTGLRERFGREARAVAALHHPNIVQVHDFDVEGGTAFMAMEFISGPTLKAALASLGRRGLLLPLPVVGQIVGQIADALAYAHGQQVVHRDVKPANILLRRREQRREPAEPPQPLDDAAIDALVLALGPADAVLTDFGVARVVSDSVEQTAAGTILGSPAYMAPEQGRGERAGPASDIYSLGVVLYELLTGRVPFDADTPFAIVVKHIQTPLPPPRSFRPDLPEGLERVLLKALAKEPADRFLDAAAFGAAVREACGVAPAETLRLRPGYAAPGAAESAAATRVIDELQATRLAPAPGDPRLDTTLPQPAGAPAVTAGAVTGAAVATAPQPPPKPQRRLGLRLLGCVGGLVVVIALVVASFLAGGAAVFQGLGSVGALAVPTTLQAELTAAALQGTTIPYLDSVVGTPAPGKALPAEVAAALADAREACGGPGCPGGSASRAVNLLDAAIAASPDSAELLVGRARAYLWSDPYTYGEQIRADLEAALERDPESADAYTALGELEVIQDDPGAALEAYARSIALDPGEPDAYLLRAALLAGAPDYYEDPSPSRDQVIADTTAALAVAPELLEALLLRGTAYYTANRFEEAKADYSAALALEPENLDALVGRARTNYYYLGDPAAAVDDLSAAVAIDPADAEIRRGRLEVLTRQGDYEAAMDDADAVVELLPAEPEAYTGRGYLRLALGELDGAQADFAQALLIAGEGDVVARYGRGKVLLEQGDAAGAIADLEAAADGHDELGAVWDLFFAGRRQVFVDLARAYEAAGQTEESLGALERSIEADGNWHLPYLLRGRLLAASGDREEARADLRRALELARDGAERAEVEGELRRLP
jgi:serine/threonine-protein kinase